MKKTLNIIVLAVLLFVLPSPCFAVWDVLPVSKGEAKSHGMEVRSRASGATRISVELEFKTEGAFKAFKPEARLNDRSRVDLCIGQIDNPQVMAPLREDRSKADHIIVSFVVDRAQLDQSHLRVLAPYTDGGLGGIQFQLRVKDFVELKPGP